MAKLTKKDKAALGHIANKLQEFAAYFYSDDVVACVPRRIKTTTTDYTCDRPDLSNAPAILAPVRKDVGSKLCYAEDAVRRLVAFIEAH